MDIMDKVEEILKKVTADKGLKEKFEKEPVKVIESILGVDLPDEIVNKIIKTAMEKLNGGDLLDNVTDKIGDLFGKKD